MKIILSIKPRYAEKIFSGEKKFEYRKRIPSVIKEVLVYSSSPVKKVIGKFYVKSIMEDTPFVIWENTKQWSGISHNEYNVYFGNRERGYAIEILRTTTFKKVQELSFYGVKIPPQSYMYL